MYKKSYKGNKKIKGLTDFISSMVITEVAKLSRVLKQGCTVFDMLMGFMMMTSF